MVVVLALYAWERIVSGSSMERALKASWTGVIGARDMLKCIFGVVVLGTLKLISVIFLVRYAEARL